MPFENLIGHEDQIKELVSSFNNNKVSHAYIFSGPTGIGKKQVAIEFSKLLNCLNSTKSISSNTNSYECDCISCNKIDKHNHPDVFVFTYEDSNIIKVDDIRKDIEEMIHLKSFEGKSKVVILNDAERMNVYAQNALLKTLEEPPPFSILILITENAHMLLNTIRSRCLTINFSPLLESEIINHLTSNRKIDLSDAEIIAKYSYGIMAKAINFDSENISKKKLIIEGLLDIDINSPTSLFDYAESIMDKYSKGNEEELKLYFETVLYWLRDLLYIKIGLESKIPDIFDLASINKKIADRNEVNKIIENIYLVDRSWYSINNLNLNKRIVIENVSYKIAELSF